MNLPTKITFTRIICIILMIITLFVLQLIPGFVSLMLGNPVFYLVYLLLFLLIISTNQRKNLFQRPFADKLS